VKKMEQEVCGYWPNNHCPRRVVGYTVFESEQNDKPVPVCFEHFQNAQLDNIAYQRGKRATQ